MCLESARKYGHGRKGDGSGEANGDPGKNIRGEGFVSIGLNEASRSGVVKGDQVGTSEVPGEITEEVGEQKPKPEKIKIVKFNRL